MGIYSESINMYFGYYHNILLIVGDDENLVKLYLTKHRHLHKDEYVIENNYIIGNDLYLRYDDERMIEWNGYFIPNIDSILIEFYYKSIDNEIDQSIQNLKHLAILSEGIKKIPIEYKTNIINSIKILSELRSKPKIIKKLDDMEKLDNSILYENIEEYLRLKKDFIEITDTRNRWFR